MHGSLENIVAAAHERDDNEEAKSFWHEVSATDRRAFVGTAVLATVAYFPLPRCDLLRTLVPTVNLPSVVMP